MTDNILNQKWQENRAAWTFNQLQTFGIIMLVIAIIVFFIGYQIKYEDLWENIQYFANLAEDFYANVSSELISIVITVLIVDRLNRQREQRDQVLVQERLDYQELKRLKALLGSKENVVNKVAIEGLKARGWLKDGSLQGLDLWFGNFENINLGEANLQKVNLFEANLQQANLGHANLRKANFVRANLQEAELFNANLQNADLLSANLRETLFSNANLERATLRRANLTRAILSRTNLEEATLRFATVEGALFYDANLRNADLLGANLRTADMRKVNLSGADLAGAELENANMAGVQCDGKTRLPDGENWTPDVDWSQFGAVEMEDWDEWLAYKASLEE